MTVLAVGLSIGVAAAMSVMRTGLLLLAFPILRKWGSGGDQPPVLLKADSISY